MEKKVGLLIPHTIFEIGTQTEVLRIFNCLKTKHRNLEWILRLFTKYVNHSDANYLLSELDFVIKNDLKCGINNLFAVIKEKIESSYNMVDCLKSQGINNEYAPLLIIISDVPEFFLQQKIPLTLRDKIKKEDSPFWLSPPEYKAEWFE